MKNLFTLAVLLTGLCITNAQEYSIDFGKVTQKEIDLEKYPSDPSAAAAVLYDLGKSYFVESTNGFDVYFEKSTKIKIFTKAGFDYANIEIQFYKELTSLEEVKDIVAFTYNRVNGSMQKTQLKEENIYEEKLSENWYVKKFTMPEIHEGSIIEYKYLVRSPYKFNLRDWEFQSKIPVSYSRYVVKMIPFFAYSFLLQGASNFDDYKSYQSMGLSRRFGSIEFQDMVHEYTMKNLPAFNDEKFITTPNDFIIKLDFQLSKINYPDGGTIDYVSTWPDLCNELLKDDNFGRYISACERKADDIIKQLNINGLPGSEQIKIIIDYVKANYAWNGTNRLFASQSVKEFFDTKRGSSANINLFLLALLNKAGINAQPVILSTRDHGKIKSDFPFLHFFNYVAVLVNIGENALLTDATEPLLPYYLVPPRCINEKGLIVLKKTEKWVELTNSTPSSIDNTFSLEFNNELDSLKGIFSINSTYYEGLELRKLINDKEENKIKFVEDKNYTILSDVKTSNFYEVEKPYRISFNASVPVEIINDKIYIDPFLNEIYKENPLKLKERNYPVDLIYSQNKSFNVVIKIPENYIATYIPPKVETDHEFFSMNYVAEVVGNSLIIKADYYFKKPVYFPEEYKKIKFFFWDLVNQMNKKIILEKKTNL